MIKNESINCVRYLFIYNGCTREKARRLNAHCFRKFKYLIKNKSSTIMLYKTKTLKCYKVNNLDGEIGKVREFYFDDHLWTIRYLIADTVGWFSGTQMLISLYVLLSANKGKQNITVNLTKKQIENSPSLDSDKPVLRQFEETYHGYYGLPKYWNNHNMRGNYSNIIHDGEKLKQPFQVEEVWNPDLRNTHEMRGYHIQGIDGEIGHIEDFIIDNETWAIRYLIVDTQNWWQRKNVLISLKWIEHVSLDESKVCINLSCEVIMESSKYWEMSMLNRNYEAALHRH